MLPRSIAPATGEGAQRPTSAWPRRQVYSDLYGTRMHDLRHTFSGRDCRAGPMIGKLLGHSQVQTTARYAHLAGDPVRAAANAISGLIAADMGKVCARS